MTDHCATGHHAGCSCQHQGGVLVLHRSVPRTWLPDHPPGLSQTNSTIGLFRLGHRRGRASGI